MIYEHEIPSGSRIYFGKSAKLKRFIEDSASEVLSKEGYEEIVTPYFSYHQHDFIEEKELVRCSDEKNHLLTLRADSTLDVVRLITKRLGRSTKHKKWFYIQPVFKYPSYEYYQIGGEWIEGEDLKPVIAVVEKILNKLSLKPLLQISNINIPKIISENYDVNIDIFKKACIEEILKLDIKWLRKLLFLQTIEQMDEVLEVLPDILRGEVLKMKELYENLSYENTVFAPLFYSPMRYYDELFFRLISGNRVLGKGGSYKIEGLNAVGFGIYTDNVIEELMSKGG